MKLLLILLASVVGLLAALFGLASGVAHGTTDPVERIYAARSAFWSAVVFALCAGLIVSLSGCSTIARCVLKDGTSRPCN